MRAACLRVTCAVAACTCACSCICVSGRSWVLHPFGSSLSLHVAHVRVSLYPSRICHGDVCSSSVHVRACSCVCGRLCVRRMALVATSIHSRLVTVPPCCPCAREPVSAPVFSFKRYMLSGQAFTPDRQVGRHSPRTYGYIVSTQGRRGRRRRRRHLGPTATS